jgi:2-oxoisovalerate dehydrogenase E1 component
VADYEIQKFGEPYTTYVLRIPNYVPRLTIATYGYNFELVRAAALELMMEHEIFADMVVFSQLSPFDLEPLASFAARTRHLLTVEEGTLSLGWGAEVAARLVETVDGLKVRRVAARDLPIANAKALEDAILPSVKDIVEAALELAEG